MNSTSIRTAALTALLLVLVATAGAVQVSDDLPGYINLFEGGTEIYSVEVTNDQQQPVQVDVRPGGELADLLSSSRELSLEPGETGRTSVVVNASGVEPGVYSGLVRVEAGDSLREIPMTVQVIESTSSRLRLTVQSSTSSIRPGDSVSFFSVLSSPSRTDVRAEYTIRSSETGERVANATFNYTVDGTRSFRHNITPGEELPLGDYYIQGEVVQGNTTVTATDTFQVSNSFWTPQRFKIALFLISIAIVSTGGIYTRKWYLQRREEEARYVFPVDYSKLPEESDDSYWVGKIAESSKSAYIDPDDLTTHAIVSGSTGSGKSVTASVIAEEALEAEVPVVVFDPTAQWTGFVKELSDDDLLEHYERFDLDEEQDPKPYPGVIREVSSPDPDIDFQELKNPGEITVFTLDQLSTEEFDDAVRNIIDQIFDVDWEESPTLEMLVVFDEVHRLLEEYGGEGGYEALERGAREFRKWGVGLMMCSQVTADFKQAISGNIMTEVQLQTKSMEDIDRVEKKYGEQFAKRISSEDVGTGMIQNSNYNEGDPWFVDFRPTYHNPHRITDEEMEKYHELSERLDRLREAIGESADPEDKELELNLAADKLKEGRFKMAKMYISGLEDDMNIS